MFVAVISLALPTTQHPGSDPALLPPFPSHRFGGIQSPLSAMYKCHPLTNCLTLFMQTIRYAFSLALLSAGRSKAARMAMIAITTRSSIKVKALGSTRAHLVNAAGGFSLAPPVMRGEKVGKRGTNAVANKGRNGFPEWRPPLLDPLLHSRRGRSSRRLAAMSRCSRNGLFALARCSLFKCCMTNLSGGAFRLRLAPLTVEYLEDQGRLCQQHES